MRHDDLDLVSVVAHFARAFDRPGHRSAERHAAVGGLDSHPDKACSLAWQRGLAVGNIFYKVDSLNAVAIDEYELGSRSGDDDWKAAAHRILGLGIHE